jgi:hypothetical protein
MIVDLLASPAVAGFSVSQIRGQGPILSQQGGEAEDSLIREVLGRAGAVLTTPGRAGTARRCGFGKRDGKEYTRNRRQSLSRPNRLQIWRIWAGSGADPSDRTVSGGELRGGKWMGR